MKERRIYWIVAGVLGLLLVVMLVGWNYHRDNEVAQAKAVDLISRYQEAGLPTPATVEQVSRVFGDDGGNVCAAAGSRQQLGELKTRLAVGGEFYQRPVLLPANTLEGLRLIVATYCPENLPVVQSFVDDMTYAK